MHNTTSYPYIASPTIVHISHYGSRHITEGCSVDSQTKREPPLARNAREQVGSQCSPHPTETYAVNTAPIILTQTKCYTTLLPHTRLSSCITPHYVYSTPGHLAHCLHAWIHTEQRHTRTPLRHTSPLHQGRGDPRGASRMPGVD